MADHLMDSKTIPSVRKAVLTGLQLRSHKLVDMNDAMQTDSSEMNLPECSGLEHLDEHIEAAKLHLHCIERAFNTAVRKQSLRNFMP